MKPLLGLTGGIASGKSTVADMLRAKGACVIDADALAQEITLPGTPALTQIVAAFGPEIIDAQQRLKRSTLAEIVFSNNEQRKILEAITHPAIALLSQLRIAQAMTSNDCPVVFYEAPLLFERGLDAWLPRVVVVDISSATQEQRLRQRDGEAALKRIASQMPLAQKRAKATYLIDNNEGLDELKSQVESLWPRFLEP